MTTKQQMAAVSDALDAMEERAQLTPVEQRQYRQLAEEYDRLDERYYTQEWEPPEGER